MTSLTANTTSGFTPSDRSSVIAAYPPSLVKSPSIAGNDLAGVGQPFGEALGPVAGP